MHHQRSFTSAVVAITVAAFISACSAGDRAADTSSLIQPSSESVNRSHTSPAGVIQHVIVIVQENRSFDNLFWGYPGARSWVKCPLNHLGQCEKMVDSPLYEKWDLDHSPAGFVREFDGGKMDGFDLEYNDKKSPTYPYQYTEKSEILPYWQMAQAYTLADEMYQSNGGPSFPAHQMLIAGTMGYNDNPSMPWGCDNKTWNGPSICYDYQTLGDEMDKAGVTWRYYSPAGINQKGLSIWQAYQAIRHIRYGSDWTNGDMGNSKQFFTDLSAGTLPQVSWVVPSGVNSDHAGAGKFGTGKKDDGPAWVASLVDAVGQSKYWNSTAIFVTWDDWGGWYDSEPPKQIDSNGLGFRVPLIVISPFALNGHVSHVPHEFGSILHFTEEAFNLPSLGTRDSVSDDLTDCFNFGQQPTGFTPFAHTLYDANDTSPPDDY